MVKPGTVLACALLLQIQGLLVAQTPPADELLAKAKASVEAGRWAEAMETLESAYARVAAHPEAILFLAEVSVQLGTFDKALTYTIKAVDLNPKSLRAHELACRAFLGRAEEAKSEPGATQGRIESYYEEALQLADAMAGLDSGSALAQGLRGETLYWLNRQPEAAAAFARAAGLDPKEPSYLAGAARSLLLAGNLEEAARLLEDAAKRNPEEAWIWREKGNAELRAGQTAAAGQSFGRALVAKHQDDQTLREAPMGIWRVFGESGQFDKGRAVMDAWCQAAPELPVAHWWRGYFLAKEKRTAEALEAYRKSFAASGETYPQAAMEAGNLAWESGQHEEASRLWGRAQALAQAENPEDQRPMNRFLVALGSLFAGRDLEAAVACIEAYRKVAPPSWRIEANLAFALRDLGSRRGAGRTHFEKVRDIYQRALGLAAEDLMANPPDRARLCNDAGVIFQYHLDEIPKAVELYREALNHDPEILDALENLGLCLARLGRHEDAIPLFEKVLEKQPGRQVSVGALAESRRKLKR
jgi:tetratricopeptide (TPR) repeat protein